jgi:thiamine monophosphate kinase
LRHILTASKVGAEILKSAVPVSRAAKLAARASSPAKPAFVAALTDGEDFELLFTIASKDAVKLLDAWKKKFPKTEIELHRQNCRRRRHFDPRQKRLAQTSTRMATFISHSPAETEALGEKFGRAAARGWSSR